MVLVPVTAKTPQLPLNVPCLLASLCHVLVLGQQVLYFRNSLDGLSLLFFVHAQASLNGIPLLQLQTVTEGPHPNGVFWSGRVWNWVVTSTDRRSAIDRCFLKHIFWFSRSGRDLVLKGSLLAAQFAAALAANAIWKVDNPVVAASRLHLDLQFAHHFLPSPT